MPSEVVLIESREQLVELDAAQAAALEGLGQRLASSKVWWGDSSKAPGIASVIAVARSGDRSWRVTFRDVVGAVRVGDTHLRVLPKICVTHFNFLLSRASVVPRLVGDSIDFAKGHDLQELIARWFVHAAELVLRRGLRREYEDAVDELHAVRGSIDVVATALSVQVGRPLVTCHFSELGDDSALNRLLKAAALVVTGMPDLEPRLRNRAKRLGHSLADVSDLRSSDRLAVPDRNSHHYAVAVPLAKLLLECSGASSAAGDVQGTAFLLRTPDLIEDGLRNALSEALPGEVIRKRQLQLGGAAVTINPDLVFEGRQAIGDVKYRKLSRDWDRNNFNQVVTFATGFHAVRCGVIGFVDRVGDRIPPAVRIGRIDVAAFSWNADPSVSPVDALSVLAAQVGGWLQLSTPAPAALSRSLT